MKYIKLYEYLSDKELLSEEDISDYFIDQIDSGDIKFKDIHTQIGINGVPHPSGRGILKIKYKINQDLNSISNNNSSKFINFINSINNNCRRWKLEYDINFVSGDLNIYQLLPKGISNLQNQLQKIFSEKSRNYTYKSQFDKEIYSTKRDKWTTGNLVNYQFGVELLIDKRLNFIIEFRPNKKVYDVDEIKIKSHLKNIIKELGCDSELIQPSQLGLFTFILK